MADEVIYDIVNYDDITDALIMLLNSFPGLSSGDTISFSVLDENFGNAMFPISGGVIIAETESITGHVTQTCQYPFYVISRMAGLSETARADIKEWLDNLGKWLERQTVKIGNASYTLAEYPALSGERKFITIERTSPAYLESIETNNAENWAIQLSARYKTEFQR